MRHSWRRRRGASNEFMWPLGIGKVDGEPVPKPPAPVLSLALRQSTALARSLGLVFALRGPAARRRVLRC
ncbi:hypothetical protein Q4R92_19690, partial [Morganella morganii]